MTQRMRLVPEVATQAMADALVDEFVPIAEWDFQADYAAMIAASPNGGSVTDADLERAAEALYARDPLVNIVKSRDAPIPWQSISEGARNEFRDDARAALAALGIPLAFDPTQTGE